MPNAITPPSEHFPYPSITMEPGKVVALTESLIHAHVHYGLGAKADPLSKQAGEFSKIDCSGFVRWCIWHATGQGVLLPDGSVNQHAWLDQKGFKRSDFEAGKLHDGAIRIAVLSPADSLDNIGHILLIVNGSTCESHGGKGPDRRIWGSRPYHHLCHVWCLTPPQ